MATATLIETTETTEFAPDDTVAPETTIWPDSLYEVIDGRIVEKPPMGALENYINNILAELLILYVHTERLGRVHVEPLFRIDAKRNLKRRPDLAFVSAARWPIGKRVPKAEAWNIVPDLAVEVVSDSNTAKEIVRKVEDYFAAGVREVWVLYSEVRRIYVYSGPGTVRILAEDDELKAGDVVPGFRAPVRAIFGDHTLDQEPVAAEQVPQS